MGCTLISQPALNAFGLWISTHDWFTEVRHDPTADKLAESFTSQLTKAIELYFLLKQVKFHETNKPWITPYKNARKPFIL